MKRWKIALLTVMVAAGLTMALAGCTANSTYSPTPKAQAVSSSALGSDGILRVGVNTNAAPLAGNTESGRIVGIDVDTAAYIADQLGLKLEIVDVGSSPASALQEGKVDIVMGIDASDTTTSFWKSSTYLSSGVALFGPSSSTTVPTITSSPKIGVQASSLSSWRVENLYGANSVVNESDIKTAFEAMESGSVDYVAADAIIGSYVANRNGYDAKILALLQDPSGYCIGVSQSNTEMQAAIAGVVNTLTTNGAESVIEAKWLGSMTDLSSVTVVKSSSSSSSNSSSSSSSSSTSSSNTSTSSTSSSGTFLRTASN